MPYYDFRCPSGHISERFLPISHRNEEQTCECGKIMARLPPVVSVIGTRDSFGIGRNFYDNGKEITNFKEWEKAGYTNPLSEGGWPPGIKEDIKRKVKKTQEGRQDFFNKHDKIGVANG